MFIRIAAIEKALTLTLGVVQIEHLQIEKIVDPDD